MSLVSPSGGLLSRFSPTDLVDKVIGNLLRVLQNGREVKAAVDTAIRDCGEVSDLLVTIEKARQSAERAGDDEDRKKASIETGWEYLHRYLAMCADCFLLTSRADRQGQPPLCFLPQFDGSR